MVRSRGRRTPSISHAASVSLFQVQEPYYMYILLLWSQGSDFQSHVSTLGARQPLPPQLRPVGALHRSADVFVSCRTIILDSQRKWLRTSIFVPVQINTIYLIKDCILSFIFVPFVYEATYSCVRRWLIDKALINSTIKRMERKLLFNCDWVTLWRFIPSSHFTIFYQSIVTFINGCRTHCIGSDILGKLLKTARLMRKY